MLKSGEGPGDEVVVVLCCNAITVKVSQQKLQSFTAKAIVVCCNAITVKVSQQKLQSFTAKATVVCCNAITVKVSQQKLQSFTAKATVVCCNAITVKVSQQKLQSFTAKATVVCCVLSKQFGISCQSSKAYAGQIRQSLHSSKNIIKRNRKRRILWFSLANSSIYSLPAISYAQRHLLHLQLNS